MNLKTRFPRESHEPVGLRESLNELVRRNSTEELNDGSTDYLLEDDLSTDEN